MYKLLATSCNYLIIHDIEVKIRYIYILNRIKKERHRRPVYDISLTHKHTHTKTKEKKRKRRQTDSSKTRSLRRR
ncbi:hypothetical protein QVD17_13039 [Tagetes erecta]|uniref:Uncharacterized protein n=1 Tax=Tagetes erecta TaxID=13708 RepID=A0AAD8L1Q5_TARER|nr:hypothetical protein QVD17_13039 [Tagetes erecta]